MMMNQSSTMNSVSVSRQLLFDISDVDLNKTVAGVKEIERVNSHRGHMRLIDGIIHISENRDRLIAYKDVRHDEVWMNCYANGQRSMPNVFMTEAAAQVASYIVIIRRPEVRFMGFVGVDQVRFHGPAEPGQRMIILAKEVEFRSRKITFATQGLVDDNVVFDAVIMGMSM